MDSGRIPQEDEDGAQDEGLQTEGQQRRLSASPQKRGAQNGDTSQH